MMSAMANQTVAAPAPLFGDGDARGALRAEAEHYVARALTMVGRARALVAADRSGRVALLTARRVALHGHLQRYQRFKHGHIFDPVIRLGPPSSQVVARAMKIDCLALGEQFGAYHARWLCFSPGEWLRYRTDMLATTESLSTHLHAELRAMQQLLMISAFYGD